MSPVPSMEHAFPLEPLLPPGDAAARRFGETLVPSAELPRTRGVDRPFAVVFASRTSS